MKEAEQVRNPVEFLTIENGKDLIISFAVAAPTTAFGIHSLTLLRTPLYEPFLEAWERGISVTFERYADEEDYLEILHWDESNAVVRMKTRLRNYALDLSNVDREQLRLMRQVLKQMNFDRRIEMTGL